MIKNTFLKLLMPHLPTYLHMYRGLSWLSRMYVNISGAFKMFFQKRLNFWRKESATIDPSLVSRTGLPDGIFSNQKSKFG
jgi:hypothetical protein